MNFDSNTMGSLPSEDFRKVPLPAEVYVRKQGENSLRPLGKFSELIGLEVAMDALDFTHDRVTYYK